MLIKQKIKQRQEAVELAERIGNFTENIKFNWWLGPKITVLDFNNLNKNKLVNSF